MEPTNRTHSGRRKGGRAVGTKNAAKKNKRKRPPCGCGTLLGPDWVEPQITGITLKVHDEVFATFASLEECRAWLKAGCPPKADGPRRSPDGVMWN